MAEEPVNKWWAVGAKEESTARKYISFLHKHSMFGGHVGLPENIRNEDPNRSLDSSRGIYDMVEVYSLSGTSCPTGTVVNFLLDNPVNPLGKTYVYPCNDTSKPMGYMVTKAEPNIWGVCVVSGILEVPLIYLRGTSASELERKDYVEYDLENKAFKFSDSGYPVYNVYQDVDGDWIAIILFGNISEGEDVYDGPFATSIADISGSVVYVDVAEGDVIYQGIHSVCDGVEYDPEDLSSQIYLTSGEDLWLSIIASGETFEFEFEKSTTGFVDTGTVFYKKIASCTEDFKIKQIQYGNIQYNGVGYPDYYALMGNGENLDTVINSGSSNLLQAINGGLRALGASGSGGATAGIGVGVTYVIPVPGNVPIQVLSQAPSCIDAIIFSPNYNTADSHKYKYLQVNPSSAWTTPVCGGWVRISVLDDRISGGACLRFYCGEEDWTEALPLFRHGSYGSDSGGGDTGEWVGYPDYYALMGRGTELDPYEASSSSGSGYFSSGSGSGSGYEDFGIGMGVSFLLPVSGGSTIYWYSDAPECVQWACYSPFLTSESTHRYHVLTMGDSYTVPEGGWVFLSILDDCLYPNTSLPYGACFRFVINEVDYTSALPLFRHGSSTRNVYIKDEYSGPFKVTRISGSTVDDFSTPFDVSITDGLGRSPYGYNYAGYVVDGEKTRIPINGATISCYNGNEIYLIQSGGTYSFVAVSSYNNLPTCTFATLIAKMSYVYAGSGHFFSEPYQVQRTDVVAPPKELTSSISSTQATISLRGSTSSVILKAGTNVSFSSDATNAITITCTASGGSSTFYTPKYSSLALSGGAETGIGHTFVLPVKAGNVGFFDDGGGAAGVWTNVTGTSTHSLVNKTLWNAPSDGWIRVSVIDNGSASGACLSIQDVNGNIPVYKYSPSFFVYNGAFKTTCTPNVNTNPTTYSVSITDGCGRSTSVNHYAGFVIEGANTGSSTQVSVAEETFSSCSVGDKFYLVHTSGGSYSIVKETDISSSHDFAILLAYIGSGGEAVQVQFGDVTVPSRKLKVISSSNGTVTVGVSGGNTTSDVIKFVQSGDVTLTGNTSTNTITIDCTGGGTTVTGLGLPNYSDLASTDGATIPNTQGITFLLPVKAGHSISYYSDASSVVFGRYSPALGTSGGSSFYLTQSGQEAGADGWVKICVFDNGNDTGKCLKFRDNGSDFPLYKFGYANGGGGYGGGDGGYSGGGSVNAPNWGWSGSSGGETARIEYNSANYVTKVLLAPNFTDSGLTSYTTPSSGWLYAFANVSNGSAHLRINGAEFKVAYSGGSYWVGSGICIPVNSGATVDWSISASSSAVGCVFYAT